MTINNVPVMGSFAHACFVCVLSTPRSLPLRALTMQKLSGEIYSYYGDT